MNKADRPVTKANSDKAETQVDIHVPSPSASDLTLNTSAAAAFSAAELSELKSIGPYRLMRKLGEGGMGQVWLAEQTAPVQRQVALKLIRVGRYDDDVLQRFCAERQSLAMMDHPAIAKVFDAGATPDGQPYFVMEYVPGVPITKYCDDKRLAIKPRLELFIKVCEGVQHAHQKAIIHRDLKPANILVTEIDGRPVARIIDFGLAKATGLQIIDETMMTRAGGWVGTPGYMSPEQASGTSDIDTRADVYSLGVLLYVLLTGDQPFDTSKWKTLPFYEVLRQLREVDPPRPSSQIRSDKPTSKSTAEARGVQMAQLQKALHGDLDWITMKALEKDRARRYSTPLELATDIGRYLNHQPIVARPASAAYRVKKYVQRNRVLAAGVAAVFVVLVAGVITSTWQAVVAKRAERATAVAEKQATAQRDLAVAARLSAQQERDRAVAAEAQARQERDRAVAAEAQAKQERNRALAEKSRADEETASAQAVNDFLRNDLLAQASANAQSGPSTKPDPDLKVRTALDRAATKIEGKFAKQPEIEASIRDTIGLTYLDLGLYAEAEKQLRRALDLYRRTEGADSSKTLSTLTSLAAVVLRQGKYSEAEALARQTIEIQRRLLGAEDPGTLGSMNVLGVALVNQDKFAEAESIDSEILKTRLRILGPEHPATLQVMNNLGYTYWLEGKLAEAEVILVQTVEGQRGVKGPEHPDTLRCMHNLAMVYRDEGKLAESDAILMQVLEIKRRVLGPEHPDTALVMSDLATSYKNQGKYAEAEALYKQALEIERRVLGPEHSETLRGMDNLAGNYWRQGKYAEAEGLLTQIVEIGRRVLGPENSVTLECMGDLGAIYGLEERYPEAEALLREVAETARRVLGPDNRVTILVLLQTGSTYRQQGKYSLAEQYAAQALAGLRHRLGSDAPDTLDAAAELALACLSQGKFADSETLARESMEKDRKKRPDAWQTFRAESLLGASLAGQKKYEEAEPLLLEGYRGALARKNLITAPNLYNLDLAHGWIGQLYQAWGKPEMAAQWSKSTVP